MNQSGSWPLLSASCCFLQREESRGLNGAEPFKQLLSVLCQKWQIAKSRKCMKRGSHLTPCFGFSTVFGGQQNVGVRSTKSSGEQNGSEPFKLLISTPCQKKWGTDSRGSMAKPIEAPAFCSLPLSPDQSTCSLDEKQWEQKAGFYSDRLKPAFCSPLPPQMVWNSWKFMALLWFAKYEPSKWSQT